MLVLCCRESVNEICAMEISEAHHAPQLEALVSQPIRGLACNLAWARSPRILNP
jgi:hypothetical protein